VDDADLRERIRDLFPDLSEAVDKEPGELEESIKVLMMAVIGAHGTQIQPFPPNLDDDAQYPLMIPASRAEAAQALLPVTIATLRSEPGGSGLPDEALKACGLDPYPAPPPSDWP
jgi:hypothetical protein